MPGKTRVLKRNASKHHDVELSRNVLCVRGGARKAWLCVPSMDVAGKDCVRLAAKEPFWLHLLSGKVYQAATRYALTNFVEECRCALMLADTHNTAPLAHVQEDTGEKRGRDAFGSDSEDDKVTDANGDTTLAGRLKAKVPGVRRRRGKGKHDFRVVKVRLIFSVFN